MHSPSLHFVPDHISPTFHSNHISFPFLLSIYLSFEDTVAKELLETSSILRLYPEKESSISWLKIYSITKGNCLYKGLDRQYGSGAIPAANVSDMSAAKRSTPTKAFIIDIRNIKSNRFFTFAILCYQLYQK